MNYMYEPWFGSIEKKTKNRTYSDYQSTIRKESLCLLRYVSELLLMCINEHRIENSDIPIFQIGQWILTSGSCVEGIKVYPPFNDMQSAVDYARTIFGVNNFYQFPFPIEDVVEYASLV